MNVFVNAITSVYVFFRPGMPVSRKLVAAMLTSFFVYVGTLAAVKTGLHLSEAESAVVSAAAANLAGFCAGWLRKEFPTVITDGQDMPASSLGAPAAPPSGLADAPVVTPEPAAENAAEAPAEPSEATPEPAPAAPAAPAPAAPAAPAVMPAAPTKAHIVGQPPPPSA